MPFTNLAGLAIMGLIMAAISIRTLYQTIRDREKLFDDNFTRADRQQMSVAAFFILIPVSVLFHEVGHAVAVLLYGGEITAFGFFFFFGFVGYDGITDPVALFWIALWGNLVSIAMGLIALILVFLRPMRSAVNYLLIMFGIISVLHSLVFYPMMDVLSDLHGDWSQIYSQETMAHSVGMGIVHGIILLGMLIAYQTPGVRLRFAEITGLRPEEVRKVNRNQAQEEITRAAEAAISQFDGLARVEQSGSSRDAVSIRVTWTSGGYNRIVAVIGVLRGQLRLEIYGAVRALDGTNDGGEQRIRGIRGLPEPERITPYILRAMKQVEGWEIVRPDGSTGHQA